MIDRSTEIGKTGAMTTPDPRDRGAGAAQRRAAPAPRRCWPTPWARTSAARYAARSRSPRRGLLGWRRLRPPARPRGARARTPHGSSPSSGSPPAWRPTNVAARTTSPPTSARRSSRCATHEGDNPAYRANAPDRCFHCKDELFTPDLRRRRDDARTHRGRLRRERRRRASARPAGLAGRHRPRGAPAAGRRGPDQGRRARARPRPRTAQRRQAGCAVPRVTHPALLGRRPRQARPGRAARAGGAGAGLRRLPRSSPRPGGAGRAGRARPRAGDDGRRCAPPCTRPVATRASPSSRSTSPASSPGPSPCRSFRSPVPDQRPWPRPAPRRREQRSRSRRRRRARPGPGCPPRLPGGRSTARARPPSRCGAIARTAAPRSERRDDGGRCALHARRQRPRPRRARRAAGCRARRDGATARLAGRSRRHRAVASSPCSAPARPTCRSRARRC